jgi:hypothetical protein
MDITAEKTAQPIVAGILDIIAGGLGLIGVSFLFIFLWIIPVAFTTSVPGIPGMEEISNFLPPILSSIVFVIAIIPTVGSILAIVGGIYALQRKRWGLALTGSIAAIFSSNLLGIPAVILITLSKNEFE